MSGGAIGPGGATGVVVLGMGRSGTSAVTGMFVAAGFHAGEADELMPADATNPRGYHENLGLYRLNEEILERLGGTWFDPPAVSAQLRAASWAEPKLAAELERLAASARGRPIAVKDPRISGLIALWEPVLATRLHPVLVIRDPVEIARSLLARDQTPMPFALAAWQLQTVRLLAALRGRTVTVAPYRGLLESSDTAAAVVGAAVEHLAEPLADRVNAAAAPAALEESLYRNRANGAVREQHMTVSQLGLWRELAALSPGDQRLDLVPGGDAGQIAQDTVGYESVRTAFADRIAELEARVEQLQRQREAEVEQLRRQREAEVEQLQRQREAHRHDLEAVMGEYERAVDRVRIAEAAQREAAAAVQAGEAARGAAEASLEAAELARDQVLAGLERAERQLEAVRASRSWRVTSPLRAAGGMLRRTTASAAGPEQDHPGRSAR